MPEEPTPQGGEQTTTTPEATPESGENLLAGKYKSVEGLENGVREARKALGLPDLPTDQRLVGENGVYTSTDAAVVGYKDYQAMLNKMNGTPVNDAADPPGGNVTTQPTEAEHEARTQIERDKLGIEEPAQPTAADEQAKTLIERAGLDREAVTKQLQEQGKLTDEQMQALVKAGNGNISQADIDDYIEGQKAKAQLAQASIQNATTQAVEAAGGQEQHEHLRTWAGTNLKGKDSVFDAINEAVDKDPSKYPDLIRYVAQQHKAAVGAGNSKPIVTGQGGNVTTTEPGFRTPQEMHQAMDKAEKELGSWTKDQALVERMKQTPKHIRTATP